MHTVAYIKFSYFLPLNDYLTLCLLIQQVTNFALETVMFLFFSLVTIHTKKLEYQNGLSAMARIYKVHHLISNRF